MLSNANLFKRALKFLDIKSRYIFKVSAYWRLSAYSILTMFSKWSGGDGGRGGWLFGAGLLIQ